MPVPEPSCCDGPNELLRKILIGLSEISGPAGADGTDGTNGVDGSCCGQEYGHFYNLASVAAVPIDGSYPFDTNGLFTAGFIHTPPSPGITIVNEGVYSVNFSVSAFEPNQMQLYLDAVPVAGSNYGSGAGTQPNVGSCILFSQALQVLTLRNHSSAAAVTPQTLSGGTQLNSVNSILIIKLG